MSNRPVLVRVEDLTVEYDNGSSRTVAVGRATFDVAEGEIVGIVGETGSGKSTLGLALLGLVRHAGSFRSGRVLFEGRDLLAAPGKVAQRIRGREIGLVMQSPRLALNPLLAVGRQVSNVLVAHGTPRRAADEAAAETLGEVGIADVDRVTRAYPHELSGGMAQRVVIAIATAKRPKLLVADEPTTGLDVTIQAQILDLLAERVSATGAAVVLVTHDFGIVARYCQRVLVMHEGSIVEDASVLNLFERPMHEYSRRLIEAAAASDVELVDSRRSNTE